VIGIKHLLELLAEQRKIEGFTFSHVAEVNFLQSAEAVQAHSISIVVVD